MGIKDKASKIDFASLPGAGPGGLQTPPTEASQRPKTAPGAMMAFAADQRSDLLRENDRLREAVSKTEELQRQLGGALDDLKEWDGAKAARVIDPAKIIRSRFANRHQVNFSGPEFEQLKAEIAQSGGNVQPIKVRSLAQGGEDRIYEIVFGHRRHEACLQLGLPVLAVVDNLDDRTLFVEMDRENRGRKDLSAWEQGVMYRRALTEGLFPSNRKLAEAVGVDLGAVGKALVLADLPVEVVEAFQSPLDLQFRWAKPLGDALAADPQGLRARALELKGLAAKFEARAVFERLTKPAEGGIERFNPPAPVDVRLKGKRVATLSFTGKGAATVAFASGALLPSRAQALAKLIRDFLAAEEGKMQ